MLSFSIDICHVAMFIVTLIYFIRYVSFSRVRCLSRQFTASIIICKHSILVEI